MNTVNFSISEKGYSVHAEVAGTTYDLTAVRKSSCAFSTGKKDIYDVMGEEPELDELAEAIDDVLQECLHIAQRLKDLAEDAN